MLPSKKITIGLTGAAFIALGIICISHPLATLVSIAWIIGLIVLISGISNLITWISFRQYVPQSGAIFLTAVLQIIAGVIFLRHDLALAAIFPLIFAFYLIFEGVSLAVKSWDYKKFGFGFWWLNLILGVCVAILGFTSLGAPGLGGATLTLLIGIGFITTGLVYFLGLFAANKFTRKINKDPWIDEQ